MSKFTLEEWLAAKPDEYEITEEQNAELFVLLQPAIDKCNELGIPFVFSWQTGYMADGMRTAINGVADAPCPERVSPNHLLNHLLLNRAEPHEALQTVAWAVGEREALQGPQIIVP